MVFAPVLDMGWGAVLIIGGTYIALLSLPVIVLSEAFVIWKLLVWQKFRDALWVSFAINLFTSVLGWLWTLFIGPNLLFPSGGINSYECYYQPCPEQIAALWKVIVIFLLGSVLIEGGLLGLRKQPLGRIWLTAITANILSYGLIVGGWYYFT